MKKKDRIVRVCPEKAVVFAVTLAMGLGVLGGCALNSNPQDKTDEDTQGQTDEGTPAESEENTEPVEFDYSKEYILKDIYADDFLIGTIYNNYTYADETAWTQFNVITAENDMKPQYLQPTEGNFNLNNALDILDFAQSKGLAVHGHVLAWHQQSSAFMGTNCTREEALAQLRSHIYTVVTELSEGVISWDVVNEAIDDGAELPEDGNWRECLRDSQWKRAIGDDYIDYAFIYAEEAIEEVNPDIKLYYNDYSLDSYEKAKIVYAMVKDLKSEGIRIDGIGMQGHYSTETSISSVESSISMFRDLGVEISVSELDVSVYDAVNGTLTQEQEILQAQTYAQLFQLYKANSDIISRITFWGHRDSESWRSEYAPSLYAQDGHVKEAFYAVADPDTYLLAYPLGDTRDEREATAAYGTPEIDGEIDEIWSNTVSYTLNRQLTAWEGADGTVKLMWDETYLYVLIQVNDSELNADSDTAEYQDSIEIYLDQMNDKTSFYGTDDGQYRVNYLNETTFGSVPDNYEQFVSAVQQTSSGYIVEAAVPLTISPYDGRELGFDCQINDANASGIRQGIVKFCDTTDQSYTSTENWGTVILSK